MIGSKKTISIKVGFITSHVCLVLGTVRCQVGSQKLVITVMMISSEWKMTYCQLLTQMFKIESALKSKGVIITANNSNITTREGKSFLNQCERQ